MDTFGARHLLCTHCSFHVGIRIQRGYSMRFVESRHSLQRAEDLPDSILLAEQEVFDAVVVTALDPQAQDTLVAALGVLASAAGPAAVVTMIGQSAPADRVHMLYAGAASCFCLPLSFIELHERLHAITSL